MKKPIPNKMFYKIGEVAELTELEPYVLRYWEGEFNLKLTKSRNNQRLYQQKDIELIEKIKHLLYQEKFTIAGAKRKLREKKKNHSPQLDLKLPATDLEKKRLKEVLTTVRGELVDLLKELDQKPSSSRTM